MDLKAAAIFKLTYPAKTSNQKPVKRRGGFTFLEIVLVVMLLAIMMTLAVPAFQSLMESSLQREVRRLRTVVHLLRNDAVLGKRRFRLLVDLKEKSYSVEERISDGSYVPREEPRLLRTHKIADVVDLKDMVLYGDTSNKLTDDIVPIIIDSSGFVDPFLLHMAVGDKDWTLRVSGFTGHTDLLEGYVDEILR